MLKKRHTNSSADMQQSDFWYLHSRLKPKKAFSGNKWSGCYWNFAPEQIDCMCWNFSQVLLNSILKSIDIYTLFLTHSVLHSVYQICSATLETFTARAVCRRSSAWEAFYWERTPCHFPNQMLTYTPPQRYFQTGFLTSSHFPSPLLTSSSCPKFRDGLETRKLHHEHDLHLPWIS